MAGIDKHAQDPDSETRAGSRPPPPPQLPSPSAEGSDTLLRGTSYGRASDDAQRGLDGGLGPARFRLQSKLGEGGMGEVWLADDQNLRREVAVKRMRKAHPHSRAQFLEEAQVSGQLEHPNIVPVHDLGFDASGEPYLVMKRVEGQTLSALLANLGEPDTQRFLLGGSGEEGVARTAGSAPNGEDPRLLARLLHIFLKICDGVAFAHSRRVIHRDLKPSNVMVGRYGEVLVLDWGLAKVLDGRALGSEEVHTDRSLRGEQTAHGALLGTPVYMAPEQARGDVEAVDERTDVYGLGAVLYQILTLRRPASGAVSEILAQVAAGQILPPSQRNPERAIPGELEDVVRKAMACAPAERYASVGELRRDVEAWLDGRLVAAHHYSRGRRLQLWARKHRSWLRAGLLAGLLSLLALAVGVGLTRAAERARRQARLDGHRQTLADFTRALQRSRAEGSSEGLQRWLGASRGALEALASDARLRAEEPQLGEQAGTLLQEARQSVRALVHAECRAELAALAGLQSEQKTERAALAFGRFRAWLGQEGMDSLAVSAFSLIVAQTALAQDSVAVAARWVADGYAAQPRSEEAARGFLALARASLQRGLPVTAMDQSLWACSAFGERSAVRAEALLTLARALIAFSSSVEDTPFALEVPTRVMALRCLLRIVSPQGVLRAELAAALNEAQRKRLGQEARDLLSVARLIALPAFPDGIFLPSSLEDRLVCSSRGSTVSLHRVGPAAAGHGPFELEQVERFELGPALAGVGMAAWFVYRHEAGYGLLASQNDGRIFLIDDLQAPRRDLEVQVGTAIGGLRSADLDGDGRQDLILISRSGPRVVVIYRSAEGPVAVPLRSSQADAPRGLKAELAFHGVVRGLEVEDLDGDGRAEVAMCLGAPGSFAVEIWEIDGRGQHRLAAHRRVGLSRLSLLREDGNPPLLSVFGTAPASVRRGLAERREELPPLGLRLLRYDGSEVSEVSAPWAALAGHDAHDLRFVRAAGRPLALLHKGLTSQVVFLDSDTPPLRLNFLGFEQTSWDELWQSDALFRVASDADLEVIARGPIPQIQLPHDADATVRHCRILNLTRLEPEALRLAREGLARPGLTVEVRRGLLRACIHALASTERWGELEALFLTVEPDPMLAADLLGVAERMALGTGRDRACTELLQRWRGWTGMPAHQRKGLGLKSAQLLRRAQAQEEPQLIWRGLRLETSAGTASLADHLWISETGMIEAPGTPEDALRFCSAGARDPLRLRGDAGAPVVNQVHAFSAVCGVPVVCGDGAWRLLADLRLERVPEASGLVLGFFPLDQLRQASTPFPCVGLRFKVEGIDAVQQMFVQSMGGRGVLPAMVISPEIGRRLRIDLRFDPLTSEVTLTMADLENRTLLFSLNQRVSSFSRPHESLFGFGSYDTGPLEGVLEQLVAYGSVSLLEPEIAQARLAGRDLQLELRSRAVRARLAGQPDDALQALTEAAQLYRSPSLAQIPLAKPLADALELEAIWTVLREHPDEAAPTLAAHAADVSTGGLVRWLVHRPRGSLPEAVWIALGEALAQRLYPSLEALEIANTLGRVMQRHQALQFEQAVVAAWLGQALDPAIGPIVELAVLQHVRTGASDPRHRQAAASRYVDVFAARPPSEAVLANYRAEYADCLLALLRHSDAQRQVPLLDAATRAPYYFPEQLLPAELRQQRQLWLETTQMLWRSFPELRPPD